MKGVFPEVPQHILDQRARTGADRWDEMWEGVLHMAPTPNRDHQELVFQLGTWIRARWAKPGGNRALGPINVASPGGWPKDYRIPDLVLLTPDRFHIDHNEYFEGPPTAVIEIRSPGDETNEKIPFYAKLGVPEVWVVDRDSRKPELYVLRQGAYERRDADPGAWLESGATGIEMRAESGDKLAIRLARDDASRALLPEE
ncbi:MAG: Uma2 family endonuclease [Planctomycetes bacterium]|nr:Uma2 family endonuclease [Planctomycetota bacterium]